jgi:hypothetical protein
MKNKPTNRPISWRYWVRKKVVVIKAIPSAISTTPEDTTTKSGSSGR